MNLKNRVLFADIDGTLVQRSLEQWFLVYLQQQGILKRSKLFLNSAGHFIRWPLPRFFQWKLVYLQDYCEAEVEGWVEACWSRHVKPALIPDSLRLLEEIRKQGARVVLLSGTPLPLARPLLAYLGLEEAICAEPVMIGDCYTGGLQRPHPRGRFKVQYVGEWLDARHMNWRETIAMADHWHDRHLLGQAAIPLAVYPKPRLARLARQQGWPILVPGQSVEGLMDRITEATRKIQVNYSGHTDIYQDHESNPEAFL